MTPRLGGRRLLLLLATMVLVGFGVVPSAQSGPAESFVASDQLAAHGIDLKALPLAATAASVSSASARATAKQAIGSPVDPDETWRVLASETYGGAKHTAWLFLFRGGSGPISAGPPDGAESRRFTTSYTGVLVDDETGEVMRWFQGGSFTP